MIYGQVEHRSAGDAVWWAVVTASTVGYGDISPTSWQARVLAALLISTMVLLVIPLITAHFASRLIVDDDAFEHDEQEEFKNDMRRMRALLEELAAGRASTAALPPTSRQRAGQRSPSWAPSGRSGRRRPRW